MNRLFIYIIYIESLVVPHKAVAEVSNIGFGGWQRESIDGPKGDWSCDELCFLELWISYAKLLDVYNVVVVVVIVIVAVAGCCCCCWL